MATISSNTKTHSHTRSISLPCRSDQLSLFDDKFSRFLASQEAEATKSCSCSSSVARQLKGLNDMYESIETMLTLAVTQRCDKGQLNELLDELLGLLDLCCIAKDLLSMSRDSTKELQSVLRRKRGDNHGSVSSIEEYLSQRKKVKKAVHRALLSLKKQDSSFIKEDHMLKEIGLNTSRVFESLLTFIRGSNMRPKPRGWSLISMMVVSKNVKRDETFRKSEVEKVDDELNTIISHMSTKSTQLGVEILQKNLAELDSSLQDLEEEVECMYRHLIKTRVSLLNILNC